MRVRQVRALFYSPATSFAKNNQSENMKTKMNAKFQSLKVSLLMSGILLAFRLASAQCDPAPSGLVAWWPGEGNANDIVGTNNGTLQGGTTFTNGEVGQAFNFDGVANYVSVPNSPSLNPTNAISVEAWYRPPSFYGHGNDSIVVKAYPTYGPPYYQYNLGATGDQYSNPSGDHAEFYFYVSSPETSYGSTAPAVTAAGFWTPGNWYHLVGTYDGSAVKIYVNGALAGQAPMSGKLSDYGRPLYIGGNIDQPSVARTPGRIDEVSIYNRALSSNEIAALYAAGSAGKCTGLKITAQPQSQVGYWGQSVSFLVAATNGTPPYTYQWQKDSTLLSGATNALLALTNLQFTNAGAYKAIVFDSASNTVTSNPANLTINPAGVAIALYPGVKIDGVVGLTYGIQSSTNLANPNGWIGLTNLTFTQPTEIWYDAIPALLAQRFYRVLQGPIPIP